MRILITGCRGFVGASFGRFAAAAGHHVLGISRSSQPEPHWPGKHLQADAAQTDLAQVIRDFDPDLLVQAAGSASVAASIYDPAGDFRATAVTLNNVLDSVRRSGRHPVVIFPSSAAVYGNPKQLPVSEDAAAAPISPYGFHKTACEVFALEYSRCFGLTTVICRIFSLFGTLQRRLLVWELYEQLVGPEPIVQLQGTGTETRDFLHVDNLSAAFLLLGEVASRCECTIVNVASGKETAILDLARSMRSAIAPHKEIVCRGVARAGDPHRWCADINRLCSLIPRWKPDDLNTALEDTILRWRSTTA